MKNSKELAGDESINVEAIVSILKVIPSVFLDVH